MIKNNRCPQRPFPVTAGRRAVVFPLSAHHRGGNPAFLLFCQSYQRYSREKRIFPPKRKAPRERRLSTFPLTAAAAPAVPHVPSPPFSRSQPAFFRKKPSSLRRRPFSHRLLPAPLSRLPPGSVRRFTVCAAPGRPFLPALPGIRPRLPQNLRRPPVSSPVHAEPANAAFPSRRPRKIAGE